MTRREQCPIVPTIECQLNCPYEECFEPITYEEIKKQDSFDKEQSKPLLTDSQTRNKEKQKERSARYYQNNKEKVMEYNKSYYETHKEEIALKAAETRKTERYRAQNREQKRKYRAKYRDRCNEAQREYRKRKSIYVLPENKLYEFLKVYFKEKQYAPSSREMAEGIGLKSVNDIKTYLQRLKDRGLIEGEIRSARAFRLTCFELIEKEG